MAPLADDPRLDPPVPGLEPGRFVKLGRRGTTWIRDLPGPTPEAPTLLLLHGLTATADLNFATSYRALRHRFRVVAMDHRGHGRGIRTLRPFRLEDCADDADALCEELGVDRPIVVGYSMGGPITQLLWKRHPERVAGMVLCATSARFLREDSRRNLATAGLVGASLAMRFSNPVLRNRAMATYVGRRFESDPRLEWARRQVRNHDPALVLQAAAAITRFDSRAWLPEVDVPTFVVRTGADRLVSPGRQDQLASLIPGCRTVRVDATHISVFDDPRRFVPGLVRATTELAHDLAARATPA